MRNLDKHLHRRRSFFKRPDTALCTDVMEVKRRKEAAAAWQKNNVNLSDDAFADDVVDNDHGYYKSRSMPEVYGGYWQYD